jgi:hypothetical protein
MISKKTFPHNKAMEGQFSFQKKPLNCHKSLFVLSPGYENFPIFFKNKLQLREGQTLTLNLYAVNIDINSNTVNHWSYSKCNWPNELVTPWFVVFKGL